MQAIGGKLDVDKRIFFCGQRCRQIVHVWKFSAGRAAPLPARAPLWRAAPPLRRAVIKKETGVIHRKYPIHKISFELTKEIFVI